MRARPGDDMRYRLYEFLVNKYPGISQRYHRFHDHSRGARKYASWLYLLWLNFACRILRIKSLGKVKALEIYEEKKLPQDRPESAETQMDTEALFKSLLGYDVVSFDVFDTLIFRPFSSPEDLCYITGEELSYMDFRRIRQEAEARARKRRYEASGTYEVTLEEIWDQCGMLTGIPKEKGMETEMRNELALCRSNPFMKRIYESLRSAGRKIVFTTDMYLPEDFIRKLLVKNGYDGGERIFLSSAYGRSKADGGLFDEVKREMGETLTFAHVGDNPVSDVKMAESRGFKAFFYRNPNDLTEKYRCMDMSPIIGSGYRGVVNNRIHCGLITYSAAYEYGYIYGGLFAAGYCHFIHRYCEENGIDRILFLSRDGEILRKVYGLLYPEERTEYVYWSRFAAAKLSARYMKYDYMRKLIRHKVGRGRTVSRILREMELESLEPYAKRAGLDPDEKLGEDAAERLVGFLNECFEDVLSVYAPQREAAGKIIGRQIKDAKKAAAVDIGWAGSGAVALAALVRNEWKIPCEITGIVAGTNTAMSSEPDMSDAFILSGKLVSYMYSSGLNRDIWKKHDPARDHNVYWELLTSSREPSLKGYYISSVTGEAELRFLEPEKGSDMVGEIHRGIMDFARDYQEAFEGFEYMKNISGRDAYAPMLLAACRDEAYLKSVTKDMSVKMEVGI